MDSHQMKTLISKEIFSIDMQILYDFLIKLMIKYSKFQKSTDFYDTTRDYIKCYQSMGYFFNYECNSKLKIDSNLKRIKSAAFTRLQLGIR